MRDDIYEDTVAGNIPTEDRPFIQIGYSVRPNFTVDRMMPTPAMVLERRQEASSNLCPCGAEIGHAAVLCEECAMDRAMNRLRSVYNLL